VSLFAVCEWAEEEGTLSPFASSRIFEIIVSSAGARKLTPLSLPAIMFSMAERNMRIVRFIGSTPSVAYCDVCRLTFRTRQEFLQDAGQARQQLQMDFEKHECKPEPGMVDDALQNIK
jgi:hypothetical protein